MEYTSLFDLKDKENYFYNIGINAIQYCISDFMISEISEDEKNCLKKATLNLHHIIHESKLERWTLHSEKRPYEEYWWIKSKI